MKLLEIVFIMCISKMSCHFFHRFLFKFLGKDDEINLLGDGSEKPEFGEWSWMTPQQVVELVRNP